MRRLTIVSVAVLVLALFAGVCSAEKGVNTNPKLALQGYDTVAYFDVGNAVMGSNAYLVEWNNATWHFASKENMERFQKNPEKYAPQYGGYCAWAAAQNYLAPVDPRVFDIHGGKLYLNFNRDIQRKWLKDIPGFIKKADANWPNLAKKL
jgi:YHS domain-containing protein